MTLAEAVRTCFRKYATFSGRASRPEYWWFVLFLFVGQFIAGIVDAAIFGAASVETDFTDTSVGFEAENTGPVGAVFGLATLLPALAAGWRRMHDTGRSGLFLLYPLLVMMGIGTFAAFLGIDDPSRAFDGTGELAFVVLALAVVVLILSPLIVIWWLTRPSQPGPNEYGPNPHEVTP
jgi:uncharacterized membrane protein YhaH (DUF805 family)